MMGKRVILAVSVMFCTMGTAFSQEISHQVLVPAGGVISVSNIYMSQTLGESAIEIINSDDYALTQGFQQPSIIFKPDSFPGTNVLAYPSPVTDYLTIHFWSDKPRSFLVYMVNMYGTEVFRKRFDFTVPFSYMHYQDVTDLTPGLYLIRVESNDSYLKKTIKIEKM